MSRHFVTLIFLTAFLAACGGPLSLLTGGGPNVAANVQAGAQNVQTVGQTQTTDRRVVRPQARDFDNSENRLRADRIETVNEVPPWVILLLIVGWLAPSPGEIGRWVRGLFRA